MARAKFTTKVTLPNGTVVTSHNSRRFTHAVIANDDPKNENGWGVMAKASDAGKAEASRRWWQNACPAGALVLVITTEVEE